MAWFLPTPQRARPPRPTSISGSSATGCAHSASMRPRSPLSPKRSGRACQHAHRSSAITERAIPATGPAGWRAPACMPVAAVRAGSRRTRPAGRRAPVTSRLVPGRGRPVRAGSRPPGNVARTLRLSGRDHPGLRRGHRHGAPAGQRSRRQARRVRAGLPRRDGLRLDPSPAAVAHPQRQLPLLPAALPRCRRLPRVPVAKCFHA